MARFPMASRTMIDAAIEVLKERCLLDDRSLTDPERQGVWTGEHAEELYRRFTSTPTNAASFNEQWVEQLTDAPDGLRLFAAEVLLVHFLFPQSVSGRRKRELVKLALRDSDVSLPVTSEGMRALDEQIGHPGVGFNARRDLQVGYLIDFIVRWKQLTSEGREQLLGDPWALRDFADDTTRPVREMRHILLHLLRPDEFERIASGSQKRQIRTAFEGLLDTTGEPRDLDEDLFAISSRLQVYLGERGNTVDGVIDFYEPPLREVWDTTGGGEGVSDLDALEWKKQLILYGPPGTSKTYQARSLSESLVRRAAMRRWGPEAYFAHAEELEQLVQGNIYWLQLHPGYSYEEFIRGLRLEGDRTRYQPGLLFEVIDRFDTQEPPEGLPKLPVVLVMDEINRTDMSRMLGEAFSLLERDQRGRERKLPGIDGSEGAMTLCIPEDLYVIGTMNEIDQSVESLDFALRRRFLWRECPFERETLLEIIEARWPIEVRQKRFDIESAAEQLEQFADHAEKLNTEVAASPELGVQYAVGHTYFADIAFFLGDWARTRRQKPPGGTYLWTKGGKPQPPLIDLWSRSLKPLLEQYLAASDLRDEEVTRLGEAFLEG